VAVLSILFSVNLPV